MAKPIIQLLSIAGSDRDLPGQLGLKSAPQIVSLVQDILGANYRVQANVQLMGAVVDEQRGGRTDDRLRVREIERVLQDDQIQAIVSLRGGSWLTRILPDIDFDVLKKRKAVVHIFGFSELTTLINIVACYPKVRAYYDSSPGFLLWGLRNYAFAHPGILTQRRGTKGRSSLNSKRAMRWANEHFFSEFVRYFVNVTDILERQDRDVWVTGRLLQGQLRRPQKIRVVGGCLSVLVTLLGSAYRQCVDVQNKWLAIEDIREQPHRLDRYLAQLKLAGVFERCSGLLIGDFQLEGDDQTQTILQLLRYHLPSKRKIPVVVRCNFGHCFPAGTLPINRKLVLALEKDHQVRITES